MQTITNRANAEAFVIFTGEFISTFQKDTEITRLGHF